jgi:methylated-DNA-[protein]-cysteine S-methyltransferase
MNSMHETTYMSPVGPLQLVADDDALLQLNFAETAGDRHDEAASPVLAAACAQLDEYFAGTRTTFDIPLRLQGSPWEQRVWEALLTVGYGETVSYGEIAAQVGAPSSARAVGAANGRNPVAIVVPCHRVIGASGKLTGYGGGLERKSTLLDLERGALSLMA